MASPGGSGSRKRPSMRSHGAEEQALDQIAREEKWWKRNGVFSSLPTVSVVLKKTLTSDGGTNPFTEGDTWLSLRREMLAEAREIRVEQLMKQQRTRTKSAEQRLAARRAARAEARDIRMKELEKQQKEADEKKNRHYDLVYERNANRYNARRDSDDSTSTEGGSTGDSTRELKKEINELDEKYKKAMMNNAQLDNEKQTYRYQVDLLKDQLDDMEEQLLELQRQHKDRCRELEAKKRDFKDLQKEAAFYKTQILMRDELIEQYGLVFISNEELTEGETGEVKPALVTPQAKEILGKVEGSLDERINHFSEQNSQLEEEVKRLKQKLDEEKEKSAMSEKYPAPKVEKQISVNGPDMQLLEVQMEAQRQVSDYKFKLKKAEQDITQLEGNVIRLESQVKRYKSSAENSEKLEEELKAERRKLQRELREAQAQVEELTTSNQHLQKRLEKIKSARNAVMGTGK